MAVRHLCVIPASLGSKRLPSKPLRLLAGKPLICVVAGHVRDMQIADAVVVATDDWRVVKAVEQDGVEAIMTSPRHRNGTERVAEVARLPRFRDAEIVVNVQGDEPFLSRKVVIGAVERVERGDPIGTAAAPLSEQAASDCNVVKVVVDERECAVRFTRELGEGVGWSAQPAAFHHIGVYAYRGAALQQWARLPVTEQEAAQRLEQLRPMAHGYRIGVAVTNTATLAGINTEGDLQQAQAVAHRLVER